MDPVSLSGNSNRPQEVGGGRSRRCLLKGCGQWFRPTRPQCRYCSLACREAARRWRHWRSQQTYRASGKGRRHRREQARRYRQHGRRRAGAARQPAAAVAPVVTAAGVPAAALAWPTASSAAAVVEVGAAARAGKRPAEKSEKVVLCACDRPGCYVLLALRPGIDASKGRHFCCALCRQALRCVLQREARWRRRRRRGLRRPGRRSKALPRGP